LEQVKNTTALASSSTFPSLGDMAIQQVLMFIADIGGYTRFMKVHRLNLAHAQKTIAILLETVLDASKGFELSKLEGDAAFFHARPGRIGSLPSTLRQMREAFLLKRETLILDRMCECEGCRQLENLSLKFVVHAGEVAFQKVKRHTELVGMDVILLHRMLKNDVPITEYVLTTDAVLQGLVPSLCEQAHTLEHHFEGIGPTRTHYLDLSQLPSVLEVPPSSFWRRWGLKLKLEASSVPYLLGLKSAGPLWRKDD
jgi:hypothetical protein